MGRPRSYNRIERYADHIGIVLPCGRIALVDFQDEPLALSRKWHFSGNGEGRGYVKSSTGKGNHKVSLHILILLGEHGESLLVDHENGDPLDCRRSNLGNYMLDSR
jgi:hypothetical protein